MTAEEAVIVFPTVLAIAAAAGSLVLGARRRRIAGDPRRHVSIARAERRAIAVAGNRPTTAERRRWRHQRALDEHDPDGV